MLGSYDDASLTEFDPIDRVVADAFPGRETEVLADWSSREPNGVFLVAAGGERFVAKFARDGDAGRIAREATATAHAHRESGLAPEVVATHTEESSAELPPYLVTRRLPGSTPAASWGGLDSGVDPERFREMGGALARLHDATRREDCGLLPANSGTGIDLAGSGWHATLLALAGRRVADLPARFETLGRAVLDCVEAHPEVERGVRPALVHNDPGPYNLLFSGGVEGLVDWELAFCGDAAYDLVWVEAAVRDGPADLDEPDRAIAALYDGYRARLPEREGFAVRRATYRLVRSLRPLRTFDSWAPTVADRRDTTTAALADRARESVRDRIDAVESVSP